MHDGDVDLGGIEEQIELRPTCPHGDDLGVRVKVPAPPLEGHGDRAVVGVASGEHAPALPAQLLARGEAGACRHVGGAPAHRGGDDHDVGLTKEVDGDCVGRDRVGELRLTGHEGGQRPRVPLVELQVGVEAIVLHVAALDGGEEG